MYSVSTPCAPQEELFPFYIMCASVSTDCGGDSGMPSRAPLPADCTLTSRLPMPRPSAANAERPKQFPQNSMIINSRVNDATCAILLLAASVQQWPLTTKNQHCKPMPDFDFR